MELRHIRYFLALAEELNFSRAAERLHISQPPFSRQIQELEEEIGAQLFYRTKRHVELTNAGKVFLNEAYHILEQVEQASINARLSSTGKEGEFKVGFNGIIQDMIPTLKKYRELYPQVGIVLKQMSSSEQLKALNEKRIDVALLTIPVNNSNIKLFPLKKLYFMAALSEKHPLLRKPKIYINDLADETFIITAKSIGPLYYEAFMNLFKNAGFTPQITIRSHDLHTVMALVAAEMGVTFTPTLMNPISGVVLRKVEDIHFSIEPSLGWRKDNHSEILKNFLTFFYEYYRTAFHNEEE